VATLIFKTKSTRRKRKGREGRKSEKVNPQGCKELEGVFLGKEYMGGIGKKEGGHLMELSRNLFISRDLLDKS